MATVTSPIMTDETGQRIATALETQVTNVGDTADLDTTDKTSVVAAVNEVNTTAVDNAEKVYILIQNGNWRTGLREESLGEFTSEHASMIAAGDFTELWNGDYWTIDGVIYDIVDNSQYQYNRGDTAFTDPGLIVMPRTNMISAAAYLVDGYSSQSNSDTHGYADCGYRTDEKSGYGKSACLSIFQSAFGSSHIASHRELMSTSRGTGGALGWGWQDADVELPTEANIYGHGAWGCSLQNSAYSHGYNIGSQWGQFKLFEIAPYKAINRTSYWLRDIVSASQFAHVHTYGLAASNTPSASYVGLRPYAIII